MKRPLRHSNVEQALPAKVAHTCSTRTAYYKGSLISLLQDLLNRAWGFSDPSGHAPRYAVT
jgi:hypothetical protein